MTEPISKNYRAYLIISLIIFFSAFALWVRLIPMFNLGSTDILYVVGSDDPLYNLRQVEQMLANFPAYNWFDVMTLYPSGSTIYWGTLFPTIIAVLCLLTGSATRPEIIAIGLLVPPLMATALVAIMYFFGKTCGDWKTGLLASGFTAVVSGQFFYRSFYGYIDHHIAEVLFSTLFCLFYIYAILAAREQDIDIKKNETFKKTAIFSGIAGVSYLLGMFTMPTMILFAMIVGIFTLVQSLINVYQGRPIGYLAVANTIIFSIAIVGLLGFGIQHPGLDLSLYSIGHIIAYLSLIAGSWLLYIIGLYLKGRERYYYPAVLAGIAIACGVVLFLFLPDLYNLLVNSLFSFFGQVSQTNTVQEARGWSAELAWFAFNYGLLLFIGGTLVMIYNNVKDEHPHQVFVLVWSVVMFYSTWQHIRYEYYLAINIALLSAVCIHFIMERGWPEVSKLTAKISSNQDTEGAEQPKGKRHKKGQKKTTATKSFNFLNIGLLVIVLGLAILFAYSSASYSYANASNNAIRMNSDWRESLEWMGKNTPDTGVNYFTIYDKKTFEYPNSSYGVMSWWDYGHMITYIAKRIPNANPFQQGVVGSTGSAAYFMTESEDTANGIADTIGIRYIITDIEMAEAIQGKFWAMATWYNNTNGAAPYMTTYAVPSQTDPTKYLPAPLLNQHYYETMISRLHNFDGTLTNANTVYYIEYVDPSISSVSLPLITAASEMKAAEAHVKADQYNAKAMPGYHAKVESPAIAFPTDTVPALLHYRLVHESPTNVYGTKTPDVKYVKVFEYVKGAHIKGTGVIEIPLISNTGRKFTYRQQSINGEFIVSYSTSGNPYDVKALGKYRISGTTKEFEVPENAVMQGLTIK